MLMLGNRWRGLTRRTHAFAQSQVRSLCVYAWGNGDTGQLGLPPHELEDEPETYGRTAPTPRRVPAFNGIEIRSVATSSSHTAFVTADSSLWTCGLGTDGQLGHGDLESLDEPRRVEGALPMRAVACGNRHTLALGLDGRVYGFGCNKHGQLGLDLSTGSETSTPTPVQRVEFPSPVAMIEDIKDVSAGDDFSSAVDKNGVVYTWGTSMMGRLGHGDDGIPPSFTQWLLGGEAHIETTPRRVCGISAQANAVVCGKHQAIALTSGGSVWGWGAGRHFVFGNEDEADVLTPISLAIPPGEKVSNVAIGGMHALVLCNSGNVYSVGVNEHGCVGTGGGGPIRTERFYVRVSGLRGATAIAAGWHVSAAVIGSANEVYTWGGVAAGALGVRDVFDCWEPRSVGIQAKHLAAGPGGTHMLAY